MPRRVLCTERTFSRASRYGRGAPRLLALLLCTAIGAWAGRITSYTTLGSGSYTPGGPFSLWLQPATYSVSDGSTWQSGAGTFLDGSAYVTSASVVGGKVLFGLSPATGTIPTTPNLGSGLLVFQDFDGGSNSAEGAFNVVGSLLLEAPAGSADAVLSGFLQLSSNPPDSSAGFEYFAAPVCATVPFTVTYHLDSGAWGANTFKTAFTYSASGQVSLQSVSPPLTTLYSFQGPPDGKGPYAGLTLGSNGVLYGTTADGGPSGGGTVFQLNPPVARCGAWTDTVLYASGNSGYYFLAGLITDQNGALYTTSAGASGTVFEVAPPSLPGGPWTETDLYDFGGFSDGNEPRAGVVFDQKGALYGTTVDGGTLGGPGCDSNCGVVFQLTPPVVPGGAWTENVLHEFAGTDGANPESGLVIAKSKVLYGTTMNGGAYGQGTVYELKPPAAPGGTWTESVIYNFAGPFGTSPDGANPMANVVIGKGGVLYGTTFYGGTRGGGTVFQLTPPAAPGSAWTETVLHNFTGGSDGDTPQAAVIIGKNGVLYGTTLSGGTSALGTVFQLTPPASPGGAWTEKVLYSFTGRGDGANPFGTLVEANGMLYGTTNIGGAVGYGTVFQVKP